MRVRSTSSISWTDITADAAAELRLAPGQTVWFGVKAQEVTLRATHPEVP